MRVDCMSDNQLGNRLSCRVIGIMRRVCNRTFAALNNRPNYRPNYRGDQIVWGGVSGIAPVHDFRTPKIAPGAVPAPSELVSQAPLQTDYGKNKNIHITQMDAHASISIHTSYTPLINVLQRGGSRILDPAPLDVSILETSPTGSSAGSRRDLRLLGRSPRVLPPRNERAAGWV